MSRGLGDVYKRQLISYIDAIINTAMNGGDPMSVQQPEAGCSGSCSSCSGCH